MSTGGAAMKAIIKQVAAVRRQGIIRVPNHPTYRRLLVLVTQSQKLCQLEFGLVNVAVDIYFVNKFKN